MRKFLSPIINIISMVLVGIAFGLAGLSAAHGAGDSNIGCYYEQVWNTNNNVMAIVGFFLLCVGAFMLLVVFLPKIRKFTALLAGALLIAAGVFALMTPGFINGATPVTLQPGLIGMATLLFIAGGFSLIISVIEFVSKE